MSSCRPGDFFAKLSAIVLTALFAFFLLLACAPAGGRLARWATALKLRDVPSEPNAIYYAETQYQILTVTAEPGNADHRAFYQDKLRHSEVDLHDLTDLKYPYMRIYEALINIRAGKNDHPIRILILGGGGYVFPHYLTVARPGSEIVVVEIDPGVTRAAVEAFGFPADAPVQIHHMDARNYIDDALRRNRQSPGDVPLFDLIVCDSVSDYSVPYQLATREFIENVRALLKPGGLYVMNLIDAFQPGAFMNAMAQTFAEVFPFRAAISVVPDPETRNTTVFVGTDHPLPELASIREWMSRPGDFGGGPLTEAHFEELRARNGPCVLTDDWAPVENLLAPVVKSDKIGQLSAALNAGIRAAEKEDWPRAIHHFRRALKVAPGQEDALENLAHAQEEAGDDEAALTTYSELVQRYPQSVMPRNRVARLLVARGQALSDPRYTQAALEQWSASLEIHPAQPDVLNNLGVLALQAGERERALHYWKRALQYAPDAEVLHRNIAILEATPEDNPPHP